MKLKPTDLDNYIQKAVAGDRAALDALLMYFHDPLFAYLQARRLRHPMTGVEDDILQETLLEVVRNVQSIEARDGRAFFAWMKSIARTRFINLLKAQKAIKRGGLLKQVHSIPNQATVTTIIHLVAGKDPTPSWIVRNKEMVRGVGQALASLSPNRRQVMELHYGKGLSLREVGAKMGLGEGAVKMHINRSLKELRTIFQKDIQHP